MTWPRGLAAAKPDVDAWSLRLAELARLHHVPGAALAVLVEDEIFETAVGLANKRTGIEATSDTLFQIGSITKPWTASLLLTLVDEGQLGLDQRVKQILPRFETPDRATTDGLTVRHLLNHTSGLPGDHFPDTGRGDDCLQRYADLLRGCELAHPVGAMYSYSNAGFAVAGLIVQTVLGKTWECALRERIIEPLGLRRTVTLPEEALLHRAAVGHVGSGDEQHVTPVWGLPRFCGPSGLVVAQARDVASFARMHLSGGLAQDGSRVLSEASVEAMRKPTVSVPGSHHSVGLGWGLQAWDGGQVLAHDGGTIGQAAALRILVKQRVAIALLTNGGDWLAFREAVLSEIALDVAGVVVPALPVPPEHGATYVPSDYTGRFRRAGVTVDITGRDGQLWASHAFTDEFAALAGPRRAPVALRSGDTDAFYAKPEGSPWTKLTFMRDAAGSVSYLHSGNRVARRLSDAESIS